MRSITSYLVHDETASADRARGQRELAITVCSLRDRIREIWKQFLFCPKTVRTEIRRSAGDFVELKFQVQVIVIRILFSSN